jgi:hypothetical protein
MPSVHTNWLTRILITHIATTKLLLFLYSTQMAANHWPTTLLHLIADSLCFITPSTTFFLQSTYISPCFNKHHQWAIGPGAYELSSLKHVFPVGSLWSDLPDRSATAWRRWSGRAPLGGTRGTATCAGRSLRSSTNGDTGEAPGELTRNPTIPTGNNMGINKTL